MDLIRLLSIENRMFRHAIFWLAWIVVFTFVKSFGESLNGYLGWLTYYIITLPLFIAHTYLVVYWAAPKLLRGFRILIFVLVFIALLMLFSFLDLLISDRILNPIFPELFKSSDLYFSPGNIIINGIGNLYIILVFAAIKMIRIWYLADMQNRNIIAKNLMNQRSDANAGIQPGMLMHSMKEIEILSRNESEKVAEAIALLSELLNNVMLAQKIIYVRLDEEIRNVKKLFRLYSLLMDTDPFRLNIEGDAFSQRQIAAFMLFSPIDIMIRRMGRFPGDQLSIVMENDHSASFSWIAQPNHESGMEISGLQAGLDQLYPERFVIEKLKDNDRCGIRIIDLKNLSIKALDRKEVYGQAMLP